jgi:hypothetical protein
VVLGRVRAKYQEVDSASDSRQRGVHFPMNGGQCIELEKPSAHSGLIGGDGYLPAGAIEASDRFQAARDRPPLGWRFDIGGGLRVNNAIPVENDERHIASIHHDLTMTGLNVGQIGGV